MNPKVNHQQEALSLKKELEKYWNHGKNPNLEKCKEILNLIKPVLTKINFLPGNTGKETLVEELMIARHILEIGVFWSIASKNTEAFKSYIAQLKCYYLDYNNSLPESTFRCEILGLNLLNLLSENKVGEFHTELELYVYPGFHILENDYIKNVVKLEQYLMEGRYNMIYSEKGIARSEAYAYFIEKLLGTIRVEIASCVEKSYVRMKPEPLAKKLNLPTKQLQIFANQRGWTINSDGYCYFNSAREEDDSIPSLKLAQESIEYAKELEKIV